MSNNPLHTIAHFFQEFRGRDSCQPGDYDLLSALVDRHDEQAFAILVQRHGPMVLSLCQRMLHNACDVEDAFQATFLALARKADTIRSSESLHSWLYKVALRVSQRLRLQNYRQKTAEITSEVADTKVAPDTLSWSEVRSALDEELQQLPEKYRAPLLLCCLSSKTRDEAAAELGWTLNELKGRLERGRKLLQARLRRRGVDLSAALLAITLTQTATAAAIPTLLVAATLKAGGEIASGAPATASAQVLGLVEAEIQALTVTALKLPVLVALALGVVALGAVTVGLLTLPAGESRAGGPQSVKRSVSADLNAPEAFQDITRESGLAMIVDGKFAAMPKWFLSGLHLVDLDGDGHLDFFMSAPGLRNSGAVAVLNDGKGHFKLAPGKYPQTELRLAHDIDGDGKVDLSFTYQDGGAQWWMNRSKLGTLQFEPSITRDANTARRQALIDINRDGKVDWIRGEPDAIMFDHADKKDVFTAAAGKIPLGEGRKYENLCLPVDLDGDGRIDFVVESGHFQDPNGTSRILHNDGDMKFTDVTKASGLSSKDLAIKGVADVNQDGAPDLLVLENLKPGIYLNDGKGKFKKLSNAIADMDAASQPSAASWGIAVMTDFDNDGIPDLLWNGKHFLWLLRGTGDGRFQYMNAKWGVKDLCVASVDDGHCFGDLNGDGLLDIIGYTSAETQHRFAVYQNALPRDNNWIRVRPIGVTGNRGASGAKIRISDPQTGKLLWYEQVAIYSSQSAQSYYTLAETERHYGLRRLPKANVEVEFYPSGKRVEKKGVSPNVTVAIREESQ